MMLNTLFAVLFYLKITDGYDVDVYLSKKSCKTSRSGNNVTFLLSNLGRQDMTQEDFVELQYKQLPYPMITESQITEEKIFYSSTITPGRFFKTSIDNDLEILNHFIFKGKRDVR